MLVLERELTTRGDHVAREVAVQVLYRGTRLGEQRVDVIVDDKLIVDAKSAVDLHSGPIRRLRCIRMSSDMR